MDRRKKVKDATGVSIQELAYSFLNLPIVKKVEILMDVLGYTNNKAQAMIGPKFIVDIIDKAIEKDKLKELWLVIQKSENEWKFLKMR